MGYEGFINQKIEEIKNKVGNGKAVVALSGGVDSSVVAVLAHRALGENLEAYFIDDYLRKKEEYEFVREIFARVGINVKLCDVKEEMLMALEGVSDNTEKRPIFRKVFYNTFGKLVQQSGAKCFLQGTNKADLVMFGKGQLQHNVGIPFEEYGIEKVIESLTELYKPQIREVARELGLPSSISERQPFPGPGLLIRCLGEVTREKLDLIREGLAIAEEELAYLNPFQVVVAISDEKVCSMRDRAEPNKYILIVRAVESKDAMTARAIVPSQGLKAKLEERFMSISDKVGRVIWDTTDKPPATIEYI
ncbi:MAG: 7-cyano-7-deazaguanine synthase [Nanoarchaeota archaeon]|nr:7-cyano-7-deazaguanine synthase [Nanoarchaeota archaeon]